MKEPLIRIDFTAIDKEINCLRQRAERAERILAALREPSEGVVDVVFRNVFESDPAFEDQCRAAAQESIRAAVAAAEQEVGHDIR